MTTSELIWASADFSRLQTRDLHLKWYIFSCKSICYFQISSKNNLLVNFVYNRYFCLYNLALLAGCRQHGSTGVSPRAWVGESSDFNCPVRLRQPNKIISQLKVFLSNEHSGNPHRHQRISARKQSKNALKQQQQQPPLATHSDIFYCRRHVSVHGRSFAAAGSSVRAFACVVAVRKWLSLLVLGHRKNGGGGWVVQPLAVVGCGAACSTCGLLSRRLRLWIPVQVSRRRRCVVGVGSCPIIIFVRLCSAVNERALSVAVCG